jgi:transcriptional regulator with XRE-family HTH domain
MSSSLTTLELEALLAQQLKALRLDQNIDQKTLALRAGISVRAVKNLEGAAGASVKSLVAVLRALNRQDWLQTVAPVASINPLSLTPSAAPRQRASRKSNAQN